jgi:DNA modification methylase
VNEIKLYNGDCYQILKDMNTQIKVDAIITDIPYFQVVENDWDNQWRDLSDYLDWCNSCFNYCYNLLKENGSLLIFTGRQYNRKICNELDKTFYEKRIIIWARKRAFNNTRGKALASGYEPICYYTKDEKNYTFNNIKIKVDSKRPEYTTGYLKDGITLSDVWSDIPALPHNSKEKVNHPTQKPIKLMERCVEMITNEGDTVLDFCMGSGSTGVACKNLNRNFIGIELDKTYFDIAEKRING